MSPVLLALSWEFSGLGGKWGNVVGLVEWWSPALADKTKQTKQKNMQQ